MARPPYPGFPPYPPGHPGNAKWEAAMKLYNAEILLAGKRFDFKIAVAVIILLLLIIGFHLRTAICIGLL